MTLSINQAAHLQALIEQYTLAEYEVGHYTAMAYCANVSDAAKAMAKDKLRASPATRLYALLMTEMGQLTDWGRI